MRETRRVQVYLGRDSWFEQFHVVGTHEIVHDSVDCEASAEVVKNFGGA